jgi:hypothetical protein
MLVELSVVELRYHAVMDVVSAALRSSRSPNAMGVAQYGARWLRGRYGQDGLPGLADRSSPCRPAGRRDRGAGM